MAGAAFGGPRCSARLGEERTRCGFKRLAKPRRETAPNLNTKARVGFTDDHNFNQLEDRAARTTDGPTREIKWTTRTQNVDGVRPLNDDPDTSVADIDDADRLPLAHGQLRSFGQQREPFIGAELGDAIACFADAARQAEAGDRFEQSHIARAQTIARTSGSVGDHISH